MRKVHRNHTLSWVISLEKFGYIPCPLKGCNFMAMTIDEIHGHYCNNECNSIKDSYECSKCKLKATSEMKFIYHQVYVHEENVDENKKVALADFLAKNKEITRFMLRAWVYFYESKKYLKCFVRPCRYVAESFEDLAAHHLMVCDADFWKTLKFECPTCLGRFHDDQSLKRHVEVAHQSFSEIVVNFKKSVKMEDLRKKWAESIPLEKQGRCPVPNCRFVDTSVSFLERHFKCCIGKKNSYVECDVCGDWFQNALKVQKHKLCLHKNNDSPELSRSTAKDSSCSNVLASNGDVKHENGLINLYNGMKVCVTEFRLLDKRYGLGRCQRSSVVPSSNSRSSLVPSSKSCSSVNPVFKAPFPVVPTSKPCSSVVPSSKPRSLVVPSLKPHSSAVPCSKPCSSAVPSSQSHSLVVSSPKLQYLVVPSSNTCSSAVPSSQPHSSDVPSSQPHSSDIPSSQPHSSDVQSSQSHSSDVPSSQSQSSDVPSLQPHSSDTPSSQSQSSDFPSSQPHSSDTPSSQSQSSVFPSSQPHSSDVPSSQPHSSDTPSSQSQSSVFPSSQPHSSDVPSSQPHSSDVPSSQPHSSDTPSSQSQSSVFPSSQPLSSDTPSSQPHSSDVPSSQPHSSNTPSSQPYSSEVGEKSHSFQEQNAVNPVQSSYLERIAEAYGKSSYSDKPDSMPNTISISIKTETGNLDSFSVDTLVPIKGKFPRNEEEVTLAMREESLNILSELCRLTSARSDVYKPFTLNEEEFKPLSFAVKPLYPSSSSPKNKDQDPKQSKLLSINQNQLGQKKRKAGRPRKNVDSLLPPNDLVTETPEVAAEQPRRTRRNVNETASEEIIDVDLLSELQGSSSGKLLTLPVANDTLSSQKTHTTRNLKVVKSKVMKDKGLKKDVNSEEDSNKVKCPAAGILLTEDTPVIIMDDFSPNKLNKLYPQKLSEVKDSEAINTPVEGNEEVKDGHSKCPLINNAENEFSCDESIVSVSESYEALVPPGETDTEDYPSNSKMLKGKEGNIIICASPPANYIPENTEKRLNQESPEIIIPDIIDSNFSFYSNLSNQTGKETDSPSNAYIDTPEEEKTSTQNFSRLIYSSENEESSNCSLGMGFVSVEESNEEKIDSELNDKKFDSLLIYDEFNNLSGGNDYPIKNNSNASSLNEREMVDNEISRRKLLSPVQLNEFCKLVSSDVEKSSEEDKLKAEYDVQDNYVTETPNETSTFEISDCLQENYISLDKSSAEEVDTTITDIFSDKNEFSDASITLGKYMPDSQCFKAFKGFSPDENDALDRKHMKWIELYNQLLTPKSGLNRRHSVDICENLSDKKAWFEDDIPFIGFSDSEESDMDLEEEHEFDLNFNAKTIIRDRECWISSGNKVTKESVFIEECLPSRNLDTLPEPSGVLVDPLGVGGEEEQRVIPTDYQDYGDSKPSFEYNNSASFLTQPDGPYTLLKQFDKKTVDEQLLTLPLDLYCEYQLKLKMCIPYENPRLFYDDFEFIDKPVSEKYFVLNEMLNYFKFLKWCSENEKKFSKTYEDNQFVTPIGQWYWLPSNNMSLSSNESPNFKVGFETFLASSYFVNINDFSFFVDKSTGPTAEFSSTPGQQTFEPRKNNFFGFDNYTSDVGDCETVDGSSGFEAGLRDLNKKRMNTKKVSRKRKIRQKDDSPVRKKPYQESHKSSNKRDKSFCDLEANANTLVTSTPLKESLYGSTLNWSTTGNSSFEQVKRNNQHNSPKNKYKGRKPKHPKINSNRCYRDYDTSITSVLLENINLNRLRILGRSKAESSSHRRNLCRRTRSFEDLSSHNNKISEPFFGFDTDKKKNNESQVFGLKTTNIKQSQSSNEALTLSESSECFASSYPNRNNECSLQPATSGGRIPNGVTTRRRSRISSQGIVNSSDSLVEQRHDQAREGLQNMSSPTHVNVSKSTLSVFLNTTREFFNKDLTRNTSKQLKGQEIPSIISILTDPAECFNRTYHNPSPTVTNFFVFTALTGDKDPQVDGYSSRASLSGGSGAVTAQPENYVNRPHSFNENTSSVNENRNTGSSDLENESRPPKKRGRPKKIHKPNDIENDRPSTDQKTQDNSPLNTGSSTSAGQTNLVKNTDYNEKYIAPTDGTSPEVKKKAGRPKKSLNPPPEIIDLGKRKRASVGSYKELSEGNYEMIMMGLDDTVLSQPGNAPNAENLPKKRGRPRKSMEQSFEGNKSGNPSKLLEGEEEPKKSKPEETTEDFSKLTRVPDPKVYKRRGRPPKSLTISMIDNSVNDSSVIDLCDTGNFKTDALYDSSFYQEEVMEPESHFDAENVPKAYNRIGRPPKALNTSLGDSSVENSSSIEAVTESFETNAISDASLCQEDAMEPESNSDAENVYKRRGSSSSDITVTKTLETNAISESSLCREGVIQHRSSTDKKYIPKVHKRRGRPPKALNTSMGDNSVENAVDPCHTSRFNTNDSSPCHEDLMEGKSKIDTDNAPKVYKRRGRPPKAVNTSMENSIKNSSSTNLCGSESFKTDALSDSSLCQEEVMEHKSSIDQENVPKVYKRRGRPPKALNTSMGDNNAENSSSLGPCVTESLKTNSISGSSLCQESTDEYSNRPAKKPGRPPKVKRDVGNENLARDLETSFVDSPGSSLHGFPGTSLGQGNIENKPKEDLSTVNSTDRVPPKKRGRPSKPPVVNSSDEPRPGPSSLILTSKRTPKINPDSDFVIDHSSDESEEEKPPSKKITSSTTPTEKKRKIPDWRNDMKDVASTLTSFLTSETPMFDEDGKALTPRQILLRSLAKRIDPCTKLKGAAKQKEVKCAVCGESMTAIDYQKKHLVNHNFMCWLEGEDPLPLDDFQTMKNVLTRGKTYHKNHVFKCQCGLAKKSAVGFLSHKQKCGKTEEEVHEIMTPCVYCGALLLPTSLTAHMYQVHRLVEDEVTDSPPSPRQAALKCQTMISSIHGDKLQIENGKEAETNQKEMLEKKFIENVSKPSKHVRTYWSKIEDKKEVIKCLFPKCSYETPFSFEMAEHFAVCSMNPSKIYRCAKCHKFSSKILNAVEKHISDCFATPSEIVPNPDLEDDRNINKVLPLMKNVNGMFFKHSRLLIEIMKDSIKSTEAFLFSNYSTSPVYPDYDVTPESWEAVELSESLKYQPEVKKSINVRFASLDDWIQMDAAQGIVGDSKKECIGFTGGPIWAMAWAPSEGTQYLAAAPQYSMDPDFQIGSTYIGPGLIQLWSFGHITSSSSSSIECMEMEFALCHEDKACWDMVWCPGGGQLNSRLGLLALATTSGSIPIYAVPEPSSLPLDKTRYFKIKPVLRLLMPSDVKYQCRTIDWSKMKPHNIIAAGFVNGMVGIWDLRNPSSLLRRIPGSLIAHQVFQPHNTFVTGLCLCPENPDYLATTSMDKTWKFWDLKDTTSPQTISTRGLTTSVEWLLNNRMLAVSFDVGYSLANSSVVLNSSSGVVPRTFSFAITDNSTSWSVSSNDWLNMVCASYDNGQVLLFHSLGNIMLTTKDKKKYMKILLKSSLFNMEQGDYAEKPEDSKLLYKESANNTGMVIRSDTVVNQPNLMHRSSNLSSSSTSHKDNPAEEALDVFPFNSINKVAWNPNKQGFTYLASGYQSGFLLVSKISLPPASQDYIDKLLAKGINNVEESKSGVKSGSTGGMSSESTSGMPSESIGGMPPESTS